jgi:prepilin-type N-terminal cleavage/methylation domain-containing protein
VNTHQKSAGFTLMEILIVMIIIGVLAGAALPQLFRRVESVKAGEALENMGAVKHAIEACAMARDNNFTACNDFAILGMTDPSYSATTNAAAHFSYAITTAAGSFQILSTRNTTDNGTGTDTVTLSRAATGAVTRAGTTAFAGVQ